MELFNNFAVILGEWPSGSAEWLAARKIGASSVGHLAAYARWSADPHAYDVPKYTPWTLYAELVNPGPREQKYVFDRGNALEPTLIEWAAKRLGDVTAYKASLQHPDEPWATCNLDGLLRVDGKPRATVEIKDYGLYRASDFVNGAPQDLVDQTTWQGRCADLRELYGFVSIGGREPELYPIAWDQELADWLGDLARDFWCNHVEPQIPPPVDYTEACATAILDAWEEEAAGEGELCEEGKDLALEYARAARAEKAAAAHRKEARHALLGLLGKHKRLVEPGEGKIATRVKVSRVAGRKGLDWSRLIADHPDVVDLYRTKVDESSLKKTEETLARKYTTTVGSPSLRVTIPKAKP